MKNNSRKLIKSILLICLVACMSLTSCVDGVRFGSDFLEKGNGVTTTTADSVFAKAETARYFLWNTYSYLYFGLPTKMGEQDREDVMSLQSKNEYWYF